MINVAIFVHKLQRTLSAREHTIYVVVLENRIWTCFKVVTFGVESASRCTSKSRVRVGMSPRHSGCRAANICHLRRSGVRDDDKDKNGKEEKISCETIYNWFPFAILDRTGKSEFSSNSTVAETVRSCILCDSPLCEVDVLLVSLRKLIRSSFVEMQDERLRVDSFQARNVLVSIGLRRKSKTRSRFGTVPNYILQLAAAISSPRPQQKSPSISLYHKPRSTMLSSVVAAKRRSSRRSSNKNEPARPVKYRTLTEHAGEVAPSTVTFLSVSESAGAQFLSRLPSTRCPCIIYPVPSQEADNALVTPSMSRVSGAAVTIYF
ncbi:hypothetical protein EVAR_98091_1 [Eumeta japonica]|uniref:Uncharacterized protein n=1 Tax=Eumeta variegata TaxID=151549 RepID=A0A4C1XIU6_EUMVA|nr:hypothetical protein EVAR_98091_1 [Eumeta japonica]